MHRHGVVSVAKSESQPHCTPISPVHNFFRVESEGRSLSTTEYSSPASPLTRTESFNSTNSMERVTAQPPNYCLKSGSENLLSPRSHVQHVKGPFQRSSLFCTSLYLSSSSSTETKRQLGNLPFLPHPPTYGHSVSAADSTKSPPLFIEDVGNPFDNEHSDALMKDFLNLQGDCSGSSFHDMADTSDNLAFTEHYELQFLSDELDITINDNGENPRLDVSTY